MSWPEILDAATSKKPTTTSQASFDFEKEPTDIARINRERIYRMFVVMAPGLDGFIALVVGKGNPSLDAEWTKLVQGTDLKYGVPATKTYEPLDPQVQFRMLTEANITGGYRKGWYPFDEALGKARKSYAMELHEVRNTWAHRGSTLSDDAYRALDGGERLLKLISAANTADEVRSIRLNLRRVTADKDDRKVLKAAVNNPEPSGLKPWREVLPPHDDIATPRPSSS